MRPDRPSTRASPSRTASARLASTLCSHRCRAKTVPGETQRAHEKATRTTRGPVRARSRWRMEDARARKSSREDERSSAPPLPPPASSPSPASAPLSPHPPTLPSPPIPASDPSPSPSPPLPIV
ncbi:hypothetical protein C8R44DRAFT_891820 [Mycena epipterygia]|nr:hypothetical protein C8R44DRAFT_891820 [Mycena epipterygia]